MSSTERVDKRSALSPKWQRRFDVFDENNGFWGYGSTESYKNLPFMERTTLGFNLWAFLFGIFYLIYLGLPKRAVGVLILQLFLIWSLIYAGLPERYLKHIYTACSGILTIFVNYFYYLKITKGIDSFDPFKGLRAED